MEKETIVRPSLLSADFLHLDNDIKEMINLGITHCHFDVMDGSFVENISFGKTIFDAVKCYQDQIVFDVHLMTVDPLRQAENFVSYGAKEISFHYEALSLGDLIKIREFKTKHPMIHLGLAFSPETQTKEILTILPLFDFVLVMSVVPGKGGQAFIGGSENKIKELVEYKNAHALCYHIGVDGGINDVTGPLCLEAGADFLVAGSYYFKSADKVLSLNKIHQK